MNVRDQIRASAGDVWHLVIDTMREDDHAKVRVNVRGVPHTVQEGVSERVQVSLSREMPHRTPEPKRST